MYSKAILISLLAAAVQARFGEEQKPIPAIAAVNGGDPGEAATIAGAAISDLLGAANPCNKLRRGDQILAELGTGADAVAAARGMVQAEQNVNPFTFNNPAICSTPGLPANPLLQGIIPLIDPAFPDAAAINALSAQTLNNPLNGAGKSIADLLTENGFTDFRAVADNGSGPVVVGGGNNNNNGGGNNNNNNGGGNNNNNNGGGNNNNNNGGGNNNNNNGGGNNNNNNGGGGAGGAGGAVDFGLCDPSMDFVAGRPGRRADEFTFLPVDALTKQGQQEALNPNIITNRICDQLTNVCQSNQAAKDQCRDCQAQIQALGTRDQTTADAWNDCVNNGANVGGGNTGGNVTPPPPAQTTTAAAAPTATPPANNNNGNGNGNGNANGNGNGNGNGNAGGNVQRFSGSVGAPPVPVQNVGGARPFVVNGSTFVNFAAACQRSCDVQKNQCANAANAGGNRTVKVSDCETQQGACSASCQNGVARRASKFLRVRRI